MSPNVALAFIEGLLGMLPELIGDVKAIIAKLETPPAEAPSATPVEDVVQKMAANEAELKKFQ